MWTCGRCILVRALREVGKGVGCMNILLREYAGGAYVQQRYEALGMALGDGRSVTEGVSSADERGGVYRARVHCEVVLEGTDDCKTLKQEKDGRSALARRDSKSSCPLSTGPEASRPDPVHADVRLWFASRDCVRMRAYMGIATGRRTRWYIPAYQGIHGLRTALDVRARCNV